MHVEFCDSESGVRSPLLRRGEGNRVLSMRRRSARIPTASAEGTVVNGWERGRAPPEWAPLPQGYRGVRRWVRPGAVAGREEEMDLWA